MAKLLYNLSRLSLLLLAIAFASYFLVTIEGLSFLEPVVENVTKYLPILLIPVTVAMVVLLLFRYMGKEKDESLGFEDFFAGLIAVALQVAVLIIWRAQGNEIAGEFASNIPNVQFLTENASKIGILGLAGIQLAAFIFYCIADPDPDPERNREAVQA